MGREPDWAELPDEELLDLRISDVAADLSIEESPLQERLNHLYRDLDRKGLSFRPHAWISDDWYTPDGIPGLAVPFYVTHPRLARLERAQMLEVEGWNYEWGMRILRHECGHAIENAFGLKRRRRRQKLFGKTSEPYPEHYEPRPYSRRFVIHLDYWYAQSHPDEDFAETFAVWLTPRSNWRTRYANWPAIKKLEYMDELMQSLVGARPEVRTRRTIDRATQLKKTLRAHYDEKRSHYGVDYPDMYDRDLRRLFSDLPEHRQNLSAARFLSRIRKDVRRRVARWTGAYQYTIDQVLKDMIQRCRELELRLPGPPEELTIDFAMVLAVNTVNCMHGGRHRVAL